MSAARRPLPLVRLCCLFALSLSASPLRAADAPKPPAEPGPWTFGAVATLNFSQSQFSTNWAGGDKGSIVWVAGAATTAERQFSRRFHLANSLQLAYGQTSQQVADPADPSGRRWDSPDKTTDQILFEATGRLTLDSFVDPYFGVRAESQFQDQSDPAGALTFNPIRLKQSAGIARVLEKTADRELITRLGVGFRQTLTRAFVDPATRERRRFTSNDGGFEWQTQMTRPMLDKKVLYKGQLLVFQPVFYSKSGALEDFDAAARVALPGREPVADFWKAPDLDFLNTFSAQITKSLGVNLIVQWRYDKFDAATPLEAGQPIAAQAAVVDRGIRKAGQFKEVLALSVSYRLF